MNPASFAPRAPSPPWGVTALELMLVVSIAAIVMGIAIPQTLTSLKSYRLHSDATAVASYVNLSRMRAASQYAPYRLDFTPGAGNYILEQLAAIQYNPIPSASPSSPTYAAQSPAVYEFGTQYLAKENTVTNCRPSGISTFPGPVTADSSGCGGVFQVYFNTRGSPVDNSGNALANGGLAIYLTSASGLTDAVTISTGGAIQTWNWSPGGARWYAR